jgi:hypothetical protein
MKVVATETKRPCLSGGAGAEADKAVIKAGETISESNSSKRQAPPGCDGSKPEELSDKLWIVGARVSEPVPGT